MKTKTIFQFKEFSQEYQKAKKIIYEDILKLNNNDDLKYDLPTKFSINEQTYSIYWDEGLGEAHLEAADEVPHEEYLSTLLLIKIKLGQFITPKF